MKFLTSVVLMVLASSVAAENFYYRSTSIKGVGIYYKGSESVLLIDIDHEMNERPTCASTKRLAINSSAPHYKELVGIVYMAYAAQQDKVDVFVRDRCDYFPNAQDILGLKVGEMVW